MSIATRGDKSDDFAVVEEGFIGDGVGIFYVYDEGTAGSGWRLLTEREGGFPTNKRGFFST